MTHPHKLTTTVLATLSILAGSLLASTAPAALAATGHAFASRFGGPCTGAGGTCEPGQLKEPLKDPSGVAVNDATGHVYVVDTGDSRIDVFEADGAYLSSFTAPGGISGTGAIAIDNSGSASDPSKEDVYIADSDAIEKFTATGAYLGQITKGAHGVAFERLDGVAVDPNGVVWFYQYLQGFGKVGSYSDALVNAFVSEVASAVAGRTVDPGLAVDSNDDLYTVDEDRRAVTKLSSSGGFLIGEVGGVEQVTGVAVDPVGNDVYLDVAGSTVHELTAQDTPIQTFGSGRLSAGAGIGINTVTGTVYVAESVGNDVVVFDQGPTPEAPLSEAASGETTGGAVLHGVLNPKAKGRAGWYFAYNLGSECTGGQTTPVEAEAEVQAAHVEKAVAGLPEPNAQYTFCLVAASEYGETFGPPETLMTSPAPPKVDGESASAVKSTTATLEAQLNPNNKETEYSFEYATNAALTGATPIAGVPLAAGFGDQLASVALTGLKAGETYYYRVVAENGTLPTADGAVQSFTTPAVPSVEAATSVGANTATFHGKLAPLNQKVETEYYFAYNVGEEPACTGEHETTHEKAGTGTGAFAVPATPVAGLEPNEKYTVCLVSMNASGSEQSAPVYLTTLPAPPEIIEGSESASSEGEARGALAAVINPEGEETTYYFEYSFAANGEELIGAAKTAEATLPAEFGQVPVNAQRVGMGSEFTTYYRVVAENGQSRKEGKPVKGKVEAYTKIPIVANEKFSALTSLSVRLEAMVNTVFGAEGAYVFEYAESRQALKEGKGTPVPHGSGGIPENNELNPVSVELVSLQPGHTYYYRVAAENQATHYSRNINKGKPVDGEIEEFTTYAAPAVTTGEVQSVTGGTAALSGVVNPEGVETSYYFAYIDQAGYENALAGDSEEKANPYANGETTAPLSLGTSADEADAVGPVIASGLLAGTTYHYTLVATNKFGARSMGGDETFTTPAGTPPLVSTGPASAISQNAATLSGTVTTNGLQTNYGFEIATEPGDYGPATGLGSIGGAATETVSSQMSKLAPGTTYYYRLTATNADGTVQGEPQTFTTPGFPTLIAVPATLAAVAIPDVVFPTEETGTTGASTKTLTNKEKLKKALKACKKDHRKSKRQKCEKQAKKKYPTRR